MKIAWFTPLHRQSAIASFSAVVCAKLAERHMVTLYASDLGAGEPGHFVGLPAVFLNETDHRTVLAGLSGCDAVFYNMGDHLGNHKYVYDWLVRYPGTVILHDLVLRSFFVGYYMTDGRCDRPGLLQLVGECHGEQGREWFRQWQEGEIPTWSADPAMLRYHLAGAVTRRATGVVVHSHFARRRVSTWTGPPVRHVPFPTPPVAEQVAAWSYASAAAAARLSVLSFGLINPNKMVDAVIEAISRSEFLRKRLTYTIAGRVSDPLYERRLRWLIRGCGLEDVVHLPGPIADGELHALLRRADIVVNLRNPHLGESSWSLLEALLAARPTIVWNHGSYAEFPQSVVRKVATRDELLSALECLCRQPEQRRQLSDCAREYAGRTFSTERYCRAVTAFASGNRTRWMSALPRWLRSAG